MTGTGGDATREATEQLGALADNLRDRGFAAHVTQAGPYECVQVANVAVPQLAETIYVARADNAWWFWWSWADRIAEACDVETAAFKIAYVLTPNAGG
jgi:hypothetical protein